MVINNSACRWSVVALILTAVSACSSSPMKVDPANFQTVALEEADVLPSPEEVNREKSRVAILPVELMRGQSQLANAESQSLEPAIRSELEASLLSSDKVDLTDRNMASRLQGALIEYERRKGVPPKPFQQADYLIISQIDLTAMSSEYKGATVNGKGRTLPGICIHKAEVSGVLKVYGIFENKVQAIKEIKGAKRDVTEATQCSELDNKQVRQLYQQATKEAVNGSKAFFRDFFAPQGYVSEKRSNGKGWVFKVSGPGAAMAEYKSVKIFERKLTENKLTNQFETEVLSIGEALVTDQQGEGFIWVYVDDKSVAGRVKLGHIVKPDSVGFNALSHLKNLKL